MSSMFSACSGPCLVCVFGGAGGGCLAGHGDDDFYLASREQLKKVLETGHWGGKPENRKLDDHEIKTLKVWIEK